jgi:heme exporter protein A
MNLLRAPLACVARWSLRARPSAGPAAAAGAARCPPARLEAEGLRVERGDRVLLHGLGLVVGPGEAIELTGPNGCGKTTLLRVLAGLCTADAGSVRWCGRPLAEVRPEWHAALAWLGHLDGVKAELSALDNLGVEAGVSEAAALSALARVGLAASAEVEAGRLSAGQRRRLALARVLLSARRVWLLDEPFTALDAEGRALVRAVMGEHLAAGGLLVYSNHHDQGIGVARRLALPAPLDIGLTSGEEA